ncbi:uncharacterized protein BX664DRAFT_358430 [Halteromyces radiatus]|uniref:uncharacterized protein n=1 Tax=Halteromyces radiatus TaxID=101107 RepID=UPI0022204B5B|nr:uncharacterized protein BX664DRAFT_358430 [Halteromyces radiatus]KAI8088787.1 hypothetical protein BX664DRAFT_358430 [Halteromyces radiatus]
MTKCSFIFAGKSGRKISLENVAHSCPQCKSEASVRLTRTERQLIILNKRIKDSISVRYECEDCSWRNTELPNETSMANLQRYLTTTSYTSLTNSDDYPMTFESGKTAYSISSFHY